MSKIESSKPPLQEEERQEKVSANPEVFKAFWQSTVKFPQFLFLEAIAYPMLCAAVRESVDVRDFCKSEPTDEQVDHTINVMRNVHQKANVTVSDIDKESFKRRVSDIYVSGRNQTIDLAMAIFNYGRNYKVVQLFLGDIIPSSASFSYNHENLKNDPLFSEFFQRLLKPFEIIEEILNSEELKKVSLEYRQLQSDPDKRGEESDKKVTQFKRILKNAFLQKVQQMFPSENIELTDIVVFFNFHH